MNKKSEKTHIQQDVVIKTFIAGGRIVALLSVLVE